MASKPPRNLTRIIHRSLFIGERSPCHSEERRISRMVIPPKGSPQLHGVIALADVRADPSCLRMTVKTAAIVATGEQSGLARFPNSDGKIESRIGHLGS